MYRQDTVSGFFWNSNSLIDGNLCDDISHNPTSISGRICKGLLYFVAGDGLISFGKGP